MAAMAAGVNVFNAWYYSFSPRVAEYERQQQWFQQIVRITLYPLLGSLYLSEKIYTSIDGEYGALYAGLVASLLIGVIHFSPLALLFKQVRRGNINFRIAISIALLSCIAALISIIVGNQVVMMLTTTLLVLTTITVSAILSARLMIKFKKNT
jgi:cation transport ATPase